MSLEVSDTFIIITNFRQARGVDKDTKEKAKLHTSAIGYQPAHGYWQPAQH
jgi:hypothetical protein